MIQQQQRRRYRSAEYFTEQTLSLIAKNNLDGPPLTIWRLSYTIAINIHQVKHAIEFLLKNKFIIKHIIKSPYNGQYRTTYLITKLGEEYLDMILELQEMLVIK